MSKILVAVSRRKSTAQAAIAKGAALARRLSASLEIFFCDAESAYALEHQYEFGSTHAARAQCLDKAHAYLRNLCLSLDLSGIEVSTDVACETPEYAAITQKVLRARPTLVLRDMSGGPSGPDAALDETDWELVRTCPAPLMLTRERPWQFPLRIAAAVDLSRGDALECERPVLDLAKLLSACQPTTPIDVLFSDDGVEGSSSFRAEQDALHRMADDAGLPESQVHVIAGEPLKALTDFARGHNYEIFVMGALTHRQTLTGLVGTLTGRLSEKIPCDFVVVKPATFACPLTATPAHLPKFARSPMTP